MLLTCVLFALLQVSTTVNQFISWRFIVGHMAGGQGSGSQDVRDQLRHHHDDDDDDAGNSRRSCWRFCGDFMSFLFKAIAIRKVQKEEGLINAVKRDCCVVGGIDWPYSIRLSAAERRAPFGRPRYQSDPSSVAKCERGDAVGAIKPYQAPLRVRVQPVL